MPDTNTEQKTGIINDTRTDNMFGNPFNVILFNDDHNPYELVILQLVRAVKCPLDEAKAITEEAHRTGQAIAYTGCKEHCEHVESILAGPPLRLATDIQPA